jgi:hypothetical protein
VKVVGRKINGLHGSTFLFSVMCALISVGAPKAGAPYQDGTTPTEGRQESTAHCMRGPWGNSLEGLCSNTTMLGILALPRWRVGAPRWLGREPPRMASHRRKSHCQHTAGGNAESLCRPILHVQSLSHASSPQIVRGLLCGGPRLRGVRRGILDGPLHALLYAIPRGAPHAHHGPRRGEPSPQQGGGP